MYHSSQIAHPVHAGHSHAASSSAHPAPPSSYLQAGPQRQVTFADTPSPVFQHYSRYLKIHSYSPSFSPAAASSQHVPSELIVHCILFPQQTPSSPTDGHPASSRSSGLPPAKTIRLCFANIPVATRVNRAPASGAPPPAMGQELVLSCAIPSWSQVVAGGGGKFGGAGGKVPLHCEILGGGSPGMGEGILERLWFGDYDFLSEEFVDAGADNLAVGGWGAHGRASSQPQASSSKRTGSPLLSPRRVSPQFPRAQQLHHDPHYGYDSYEADQTVPYLRVDMQAREAAHANGTGIGSYSYQDQPARPLSRSRVSSAPSMSYQSPPPPPPGTIAPTFTQYWPAPSTPVPPPTFEPRPNDTSTPAMIRQVQTPKGKQNKVASDSEDGGSASKSKASPASKQNTAKATLDLQGDLGLMAIGWNNDEWLSRRRIVQFWRKQEGATIRVAFRPLAQADYLDHLITVSCIYREDTNECYVTSVDTIYLLEALIGVRFSVEEKNRIRRNLEGLKPDTVSKNKPETEPFFKVVMGLSQPKPRNIEKDVKVFKWSSFGDALVKIIGKYSVAYDPKKAAPVVPGPLQPLPSTANSNNGSSPAPHYEQYQQQPPRSTAQFESQYPNHSGYNQYPPSHHQSPPLYAAPPRPMVPRAISYQGPDRLASQTPPYHSTTSTSSLGKYSSHGGDDLDSSFGEQGEYDYFSSSSGPVITSSLPTSSTYTPSSSSSTLSITPTLPASLASPNTSFASTNLTSGLAGMGIELPPSSIGAGVLLDIEGSRRSSARTLDGEGEDEDDDGELEHELDSGFP